MCTGVCVRLIFVVSIVLVVLLLRAWNFVCMLRVAMIVKHFFYISGHFFNLVYLVAVEAVAVPVVVVVLMVHAGLVVGAGEAVEALEGLVVGVVEDRGGVGVGLLGRARAGDGVCWCQRGAEEGGALGELDGEAEGGEVRGAGGDGGDVGEARTERGELLGGLWRGRGLSCAACGL